VVQAEAGVAQVVGQLAGVEGFADDLAVGEVAGVEGDGHHGLLRFAGFGRRGVAMHLGQLDHVGEEPAQVLELHAEGQVGAGPEELVRRAADVAVAVVLQLAQARGQGLALGAGGRAGVGCGGRGPGGLGEALEGAVGERGGGRRGRGRGGKQGGPDGGRRASAGGGRAAARRSDVHWGEPGRSGSG